MIVVHRFLTDLSITQVDGYELRIRPIHGKLHGDKRSRQPYLAVHGRERALVFDLGSYSSV